MLGFYNLVDVYMDAVFFPKCVDAIHTFQQEGWHLALGTWHYDLNDPSEDMYLVKVLFVTQVIFNDQKCKTKLYKKMGPGRYYDYDFTIPMKPMT